MATRIATKSRLLLALLAIAIAFSFVMPFGLGVADELHRQHHSHMLLVSDADATPGGHIDLAANADQQDGPASTQEMQEGVHCHIAFVFLALETNPVALNAFASSAVHNWHTSRLLAGNDLLPAIRPPRA